MEYNDKELTAIVTTEKYKYYKEYVERLEKDYDGLLDEIGDLEKEIKRLKYENKNLKKVNNEYKKSGILNDADAQRYREMCISQKKKINELKLLLRAERAKH